MSDYDERRRITYGSHDDDDGFGVAIFIPVCPTCGCFVKADATMSWKYGGLDQYIPYVEPVEPNGTCKRHGRVAMLWEGFA